MNILNKKQKVKEIPKEIDEENSQISDSELSDEDIEDINFTEKEHEEMYKNQREQENAMLFIKRLQIEIGYFRAD